MTPGRLRLARMGLGMLLAAAAASLESTPVLAQVPQERAALFVLDASRSMRSTVDGKSKIAHARDVIGELADAHATRRPLGLVTFGGRNASSCSDVATPVPLGGSAASMRAALEGADPTGVAPVGEALRTAFEAGVAAAKPFTLVLVADGPDTCNADLCAAAKAMKEQAPGLQIHAIGFVSSEPRKVEALACVAEATGGRFTIARGRSGLAQAVAAAVGVPADRVAAAAPEAATVPPTAVGAPTAVQASAFTAPRAEGEPRAAALPALTAPLIAGGAASAAPAAPRPVLALAPTGANTLPTRSRTDAGLGQSAPRPPNNTLPKVPVSLAAALADQLPMLKQGVVWRVFSAVKDEAGAHPVVTESNHASPMLSLAPGDYIVHCAYGRAQATKQIRVGGGPAYHRLVLDAGALRLAAVVGADRPISPDLVSFAIYLGDPETTRENVLVVPAARPGRVIRLGVGTYHVVSRYGDGNALVRANVRVEAGRLTEATVHHKAARITLKLVGEPGGEAIADTAWMVKTKAGETVQESLGAFSSHVLAAGDYTAAARHNDRTFRRDFRVEPGADREVEVLAR